MRDMFESLACYQSHYEYASEYFVCSSPHAYDLYAESPHVNPVRGIFDHHSFYLHVVCYYYQSFDHDVNSCPHYDVSDECQVKHNAMIETVDQEHEHFVSEMREFGLLYKIDPSLPFPSFEASLYDYCESSLSLESNVVVAQTDPSLPFLRLEASVYDDCESSLLLESNVFVNTPVTYLEEMLDPPLMSLPLVTLSFLAPPQPLVLVTRPYLLLASLQLNVQGQRMLGFLMMMLVLYKMLHLVGRKSLQWLSHVLRRHLQRNYVVMMSWLRKLLALDLRTPFVPIHLTRCPFHPLYFPPPYLICMRFTFRQVSLRVSPPPLSHIAHTQRTCLEKSCRVLSLITLLTFIWQLMSLTGH